MWYVEKCHKRLFASFFALFLVVNLWQITEKFGFPGEAAPNLIRLDVLIYNLSRCSQWFYWYKNQKERKKKSDQCFELTMNHVHNFYPQDLTTNGLFLNSLWEKSNWLGKSNFMRPMNYWNADHKAKQFRTLQALAVMVIFALRIRSWGFQEDSWRWWFKGWWPHFRAQQQSQLQGIVVSQVMDSSSPWTSLDSLHSLF